MKKNLGPKTGCLSVDASPDTVRAVAEAMQLAALLDDRVGHTDDARITAWAEQVHRHRLERGDLLDAVQAFYDSPSERAIQVGDLIHHARYARQSRVAKEADQDRDRRAEGHHAKADDSAANEIRAITAGTPTGPTRIRTPRLEAAETALQCCTNRREAQAAIHEYLTARHETIHPRRQEPSLQPPNVHAHEQTPPCPTPNTPKPTQEHTDPKTAAARSSR